MDVCPLKEYFFVWGTTKKVIAEARSAIPEKKHRKNNLLPF